MYITEVSKWRVEYGLYYNTCIPDEFKFIMEEDVIRKSFVYDLAIRDGRLIPPESHPCFGQMQEIEVNADVNDKGVTLIHIQGMNDRYDRWMKAIFAIRQTGNIWEGKLVLFDRGGMYKGASYQSQWSRFKVVGFRIIEFKNPTLIYDHLSIDDKGAQIMQRCSISIDFGTSLA